MSSPDLSGSQPVTPSSLDTSWSPDAPALAKRFAELDALDWRCVLQESDAASWQDRWTLDGATARIVPVERGFEFLTEPEMVNANHAVLWTREELDAPLKISYEFTRLDSVIEGVVITYLLARGEGSAEYPEDIAEWADKRTEAAMRLYFEHMHLYLLSYAAFDIGNTKPDKDYIRARRYRPDLGRGIGGTDLPPDSFDTGLFHKDVPYRMTILIHEAEMFLRVAGDGQEACFGWKLDGHPLLTRGRVGLRHMGSHCARYCDLQIFQAG